MHSKDLLSLSNISASYGANRILDNVSLSVQEGQIFGLIGLNGVGKTTLIKTILGLRDADNGSSYIDGYKSGVMGAKKNIAYLPERFEPSWFLTGLGFLSFALKLYGLKPDDKQVEDAANLLDLDTVYLKKMVSTYSKGMRQKLGIMSVVLPQCKLLILDEPMSGLDPKARHAVKIMLLKCKKEGRCVFFSSHILQDMAEICDHVAVLHNKKIQFHGTVHEMLDFGNSQNLEEAFLHIIGDGSQKAA